MKEFQEKESYTVDDLQALMTKLRAECPWDRVQTHQSIRRNFLEETYEALEAIDNEDVSLLREELGDVLLQVVFHTEMEREQGHFDLDDVADGICKKLVFRHPHIFGERKLDSAGSAYTAWEELKKIEKGQKTTTESMQSVAKTLPALVRAEKLQSKAAKAGFTWPSMQDALAKVREELAELEEAVQAGKNQEKELGDLLFAATNIARFLGADPEEILEKTNQKFIRRFAYVENQAAEKGQTVSQMTLAEMCVAWDEIRKQEKE